MITFFRCIIRLKSPLVICCNTCLSCLLQTIKCTQKMIVFEKRCTLLQVYIYIYLGMNFIASIYEKILCLGYKKWRINDIMKLIMKRKNVRR